MHRDSPDRVSLEVCKLRGIDLEESIDLFKRPSSGIYVGCSRLGNVEGMIVLREQK